MPVSPASKRRNKFDLMLPSSVKQGGDGGFLTIKTAVLIILCFQNSGYYSEHLYGETSKK